MWHRHHQDAGVNANFIDAACLRRFCNAIAIPIHVFEVRQLERERDREPI